MLDWQVAARERHVRRKVSKMADWDQEGFEPGEFPAEKEDPWVGEDEDEDELKENWDDEDEEEDKKMTPEETTASTKKRKTVKQKILEKEEQKKEEMLKKAQLKKEMAENEDSNDDEESIFASSELDEKLRKQKLQEDSDLDVAKDLFGVSSNADDVQKSIDSFKPTNKEEFTELSRMIVEKLTQFETSIEYTGFLETLMRDLATGIEADEVKKLSSVLNVLASEKQKAQKVIKGKKKGKKAVLGGGAKGSKAVDLSDYSTLGDEYDDFM